MAAPKPIQVFAAPTEYERQAAEARRRQALAEALEAQAYQPLSGSAAPTPSAAPLVMALQSFLSARQRRKAEEAGEKAKTADIEGMRELVRQLGPQERTGAETAMEQMRGTAMPGQLSAQGTYTPSQITPMSAPIGMPYTQAAPTGQERQNLLLQAQFGGTPRAGELAKALMAVKPEEFDIKETGVGLMRVGKTTGAAQPITYGGEVLMPRSEAKGTELSRLISERAALKPGDPNIAIYDAAIKKETTRPQAAVTNIYGTGVEAGVDEEGNPVFFQTSKTGGAPSIVSGVRPAPKGMNENQAKAAGFADRINESVPVLNTAPQSVGASALSGVPGGNFALTPEQQSFFQAERNFINAVLRRESGAVISPEEFSNARMQYIPQPGDSPQVLEQKRRNRETVQRSFARDAGPSYKPVIDLPPR